MNKDLEKIPKVYLITCIPTNKVYVGKTVKTLRRRWQRHCLEARQGNICKISAAIRKYGPENFSIEILEVFKTDEEAFEGEKKWIAIKNSLQNGLNTAEGGYGFTSKSASKIGRQSWVRKLRSKIIKRLHKRKSFREAIARARRNPDVRNNQKRKMLAYWKNSSNKKKLSNSLKKVFKNPAIKRKIKNNTTRCWYDSEYRKAHQRKVKWLEENIVFASLAEVSRHTGLPIGSIHSLVSGRSKRIIPGITFVYDGKLGEQSDERNVDKCAKSIKRIFRLHKIWFYKAAKVQLRKYNYFWPEILESQNSFCSMWPNFNNLKKKFVEDNNLIHMNKKSWINLGKPKLNPNYTDIYIKRK